MNVVWPECHSTGARTLSSDSRPGELSELTMRPTPTSATATSWKKSPL